jgi:molybdopterin/thiamine biosynthesis adenylyltransferase
VTDMLAPQGFKLTLIDPDVLSQDNLKRHVLDARHVGKYKAFGMGEKYSCGGICRKFDAELLSPRILHADPGGRTVTSRKPDIIASCVDSLACESLINAYSLNNDVPVVYGGVHGDAHTAEIITVIPGKTPCYDCYEREGPVPEPGQEAYTNPNYDKTKMAHQEGLWCDVLMAASLQVQAILGVLGLREKFPPLVLASLRYPFKIEIYDQKPGCAVCTDNMEALRM